MEMRPEAEEIYEAADRKLRPIKRVEYEQLVAAGCFADEPVELLFGMVVPMAPIDPAHSEVVVRVNELLQSQLAGRARVFCQTSFAATEDSEPEPDIFIVPRQSYWTAHPERAFLVVEVARSSLRRDRAKRLVYGRADVDEYWIVNHPERCVEVYRDRHDGVWQSMTTHGEGEIVRPLAFPDIEVAVEALLPPL
jgi:Uma2 family endonuclease